jgi:hypothetical protein
MVRRKMVTGKRRQSHLPKGVCRPERWAEKEMGRRRKEKEGRPREEKKGVRVSFLFRNLFFFHLVLKSVL